MSDLTTTPSPPTIRTSWQRTAARWMITFVGFPLGGLLASLVVGPVDSPMAAILGGLLTGLVLGAAQWWGLGSRNRPSALRWIAATSVGLAVGLGLGTALVGYGTTLGAIVVQGAVCGLAVGASQAFVLRSRLGRLALAWPPALAAVWAGGWAITTSVGVAVGDQFTVFGSSGALVVTAATAVLPVVLSQHESSAA